MNTTEINSITNKIDKIQNVFNDYELSTENYDLLNKITKKYVINETIKEENTTDSESSTQSIPQIKYDVTDATETHHSNSTTEKSFTENTNSNNNQSINISEFHNSSTVNNLSEKKSSIEKSNSSENSKIFKKNPTHSKKN